MTVFYPDVSNNQWGGSLRNALNFCDQLVPQGFSGVCHKMSEGSFFVDPFGAAVSRHCRDINLPFLGYHYVGTQDPVAQVKTWRAAGGGDVVMLDWETNSGNVANLFAVANAFKAGGVDPRVGYCPHWYWNSVGGGDLSAIPALVSSSYVGGSGFAAAMYLGGGGDQGAGWAPYGNNTPKIWQFTDHAMVAGIAVDCNAFKGTAEELAQLFSPQDTWQLIWNEIMGV